ncbi:MAG TPA: Amuc_1100 family pilus-like protein, partial [Candidatus Limnocylindria bacterium]|nr:Amuc_1100 family pilus-like protein [Candidatus Limnocylindria bacterium]
MSWIKRNLSLVISGVIALGLLGFGGYYLWSAMQKNKAIDDQINQAKSEIERLLAMDPTPNPSNLVNARRELERLNSFIVQARRHFPLTPAPAVPLNNESFKNLLERTIYDLHRQAGSVDIKVDTNYFFSFETWRIPVNFPPESLRPLSERLHEVQLISSILFKARINRLVSIQRAMVPGERPTTQTDYLNRSSQTNSETGMVLWPYEVVFHSFTPELGAVIEAL